MTHKTRSVRRRKVRQILIATSHGERAADKFQNIFRVHADHIRSEIFAAVVDKFPYDLHRREFFFDVNLDERILFVVFQQNIVLRRVLFDKIVFQNERFFFGRAHNVTKIDDVFDKFHRFFGFYGRVEILTYPVFKVDRFPDVNDRAGSVRHNIYAGALRKVFQFLSDYVVHGRIFEK